MNTKTEYTEPVARLLELGEPEWGGNWLDYREYGITADDVPELIRLVTDLERYCTEEEGAESWGPVHAWRALGQLRAEAAITPLINLFQEIDDDYFTQDIPEVFGMIGPRALPALAVYLSYPYRDYYARGHAGESIVKIGQGYPETREQCIQFIAGVLEKYEWNDPTFNGFLVANLMDLDAKSMLPLIREAFDSDNVDEMVIDLDSVLEEMGEGVS
jgi:hypothetical protein